MTLTTMIVYEHGDETFIQYSNELQTHDLTFMIGSFLRLFHNLEIELVKE